jgi:hypothetical protein
MANGTTERPYSQQSYDLQTSFHSGVIPLETLSGYPHSGGLNAPPTLKFLGSWMALHQLEGWIVVEADDPLTVGKWIYGWSDVGEHEITPVTDYEGMRSILG